jgi:hypothetical protein
MNDPIGNFIGGLVDVITNGVWAFIILPVRISYQIEGRITKTDFLWRYRVPAGTIMWVFSVGLVIYLAREYVPMTISLMVFGILFLVISFVLGLIIWWNENVK